MLDIMRRKKRLKIVLWLVIFALSLGMLLFFVPGQNVGVGGFDSSAASVDGDDISMKEYYDAYRRMLDNFSAQGRNRLDPEVLKALGLNRQALDALINVRVIDYAAKRMGLGVSAQEVREAVQNNPNMQDRGQFIGVERYKALLAANNLTVTQFEDGMRQMLLTNKLRDIVTDSLEVSEREMRDQFARESVEAQVAFVTLKREDFVKQVKPSDAELKAYYDAHKSNFRVGERRRAQYLLIPTAAAAKTVEVTSQDVETAWARQAKEETVDASHILFAVQDPSKEAEVRAKAEGILKRIKAGEDFAALAKQFSDDPGSKELGGNLGPFARGRMVKPFSDAAFSLQPGQVSDLVRTQYGFHIIKVLRHITPTLENSRASIEQEIRRKKASDLIKSKALEAQNLAEKSKDLASVAKQIGIAAEVKETGLLGLDADATANGISVALLTEMFKLKDINAVGKAAEHPLGQAIPKLVEVVLPRIPEFSEAKPRVEQEYLESRSADLMKDEAKRLSEDASKAGDLQKAAKQAGLSLKTSTLFKRDGTPDSEIGSSPDFNAAAFETNVGAVSNPVSLDGGKRAAVLQVKSRTPFDEAAYEKRKSELRERILSTLRDAYFQEYVRRVQQDLEKAGKIRINQRALEQVAQLR
jgi:peptidyl-prolyl cis-trans isomerase D